MKHAYTKTYNANDDRMAIDILLELSKDYPTYKLYISVKEPPNGTAWTKTLYPVLDVLANVSVNNMKSIAISNMIMKNLIEDDHADRLSASFDNLNVKTIAAEDFLYFMKRIGKASPTKNDEISVLVYRPKSDEDDEPTCTTYNIDEIFVNEENSEIIITVF